jgi:hypothetical protein
MMWFRKTKPLTLEQQLAVLDECGIKMRSDLTVDDLLAVHSREQYEKEPFEPLLLALAGELKRDPYTDFSDCIWRLNRKCIQGTGSYATVAARMSRLTGFSMPIADARDYVNIAEGKAWLSFTLDGMQYKWDFLVSGNTIDPKMLSKMADLLKLVGAGKRFIQMSLNDQEMLIGCARPEQLMNLREKTKLPYDWMS